MIPVLDRYPSTPRRPRRTILGLAVLFASAALALCWLIGALICEVGEQPLFKGLVQ